MYRGLSSIASLLLHLSYLHNHRLSVTETSHIHWTFNTLSNNGFKDPSWVWCALMKCKYHTLGWHYSVGKVHGHCLQLFFLSNVIKNAQNTSLVIWTAKTWKWQLWKEKEFNEKISCGLTGIPHTVQAGLQVTVSLFLPPQCWVLERNPNHWVLCKKIIAKVFQRSFSLPVWLGFPSKFKCPQIPLGRHHCALS